MLKSRINFVNIYRCYFSTHVTLKMSSASHNSKSSTTASFDIEHDPNNLTFELSLPGCNEKGYISYQLMNESTLDLQHTFVPESMRGQGIAKKLAKYAFDYVSEHNLKMKLSCWYLQKYLKENAKPEYMLRVIAE